MMYICLDCGSITWEEIADCYSIYCLKKDGDIEKIEQGITGKIMKRCFYCRSDNLLYIEDKEIDKLNKLIEVNNEERLELIKKWGWLE